MSSRQATDYWRAKFRDETVLQEQRETLLRASGAADTPDVLLRAAQTNSPQTPDEQMLRASQEREQA